ncbi:MAG: TIGR01459 family HAD-type hydrolase [Alphaproteobacteria bacterium]
MSEDIEIIESAGAFLQQYEGLFCDLWGVVHNGKEPYAGAVETLQAYRQQGGYVVLLSNSPRPHDRVADQLREIGVAGDAYDAIVSSGDLTRDAIGAGGSGGGYGDVFLHIGPSRDEPTFAGLNLIPGDIDTAEFMLCTGPYDDTNETPEDYRDLFRVALARKLPFVCANPDLQVMRGQEVIYCAGALAALYEEMGGAAVKLGKPWPMAYEGAHKALNQVAGRTVDPAKVLAIGDGPKTDIQGANNQGLDVLLVAQGIEAKALGYRESAPLDATRVTRQLTEWGLSATAATKGLKP